MTDSETYSSSQNTRAILGHAFAMAGLSPRCAATNETIVNLLNDRIHIRRSDLSIVVRDDAGRPSDVDLVQAVEAFAVAHPDLFAARSASAVAGSLGGKMKRPTKGAPAGLTADADAKARRVAEAKAAAETITSNPWLAQTKNLTHQHILMTGDPARAARLRAEAGR